jgi:hypothetical protein
VSDALPGGGSGDWVTEIFYEGIKSKKYNCFVRANTKMSMLYIGKK